MSFRMHFNRTSASVVPIACSRVRYTDGGRGGRGGGCVSRTLFSFFGNNIIFRVTAAGANAHNAYFYFFFFYRLIRSLDVNSVRNKKPR